MNIVRIYEVYVVIPCLWKRIVLISIASKRMEKPDNAVVIAIAAMCTNSRLSKMCVSVRLLIPDGISLNLSYVQQIYLQQTTLKIWKISVNECIII